MIVSGTPINTLDIIKAEMDGDPFSVFVFSKQLIVCNQSDVRIHIWEYAHDVGSSSNLPI